MEGVFHGMMILMLLCQEAIIKKLGQIISEKESKDWILMYPEDNSVITLGAHFYNKNIKLSELLQTKIS